MRSYSLRKVSKDYRTSEIESWQRKGGVLFSTEDLFLRHKDSFFDPRARCGAEILVLDEAHTMIKNAKCKIAKELRRVRTKRRILLTGTPLQNNVTEFFQLVHFVRPGAIPDAKSEAEFEKNYR